MWEQIIPQLFGAIVNRAMQGSPKAAGIDFKKLRADAEAAGFNALTALGATGAAGYERTISEGALSSAAFMGEAVSNGLTSWFNQKNEVANPVPQGGQGLQVDAHRSLYEAAAYQPPVLSTPSITEFGPLPNGAFDDSGLYRANPDAPPEVEADLWAAARDGQLLPFVGNVALRNLPTEMLVGWLSTAAGPASFVIGGNAVQKETVVKELARRGYPAEALATVRGLARGVSGPQLPPFERTRRSHNPSFLGESLTDSGWYGWQ